MTYLLFIIGTCSWQTTGLVLYWFLYLLSRTYSNFRKEKLLKKLVVRDDGNNVLKTKAGIHLAVIVIYLF